MTASNWYLDEDGKVKGPFLASEIMARVHSGDLSLHARMTQDPKQSNWQTVQEFIHAQDPTLSMVEALRAAKERKLAQKKALEINDLPANSKKKAAFSIPIQLRMIAPLALILFFAAYGMVQLIRPPKKIPLLAKPDSEALTQAPTQAPQNAPFSQVPAPFSNTAPPPRPATGGPAPASPIKPLSKNETKIDISKIEPSPNKDRDTRDERDRDNRDNKEHSDTRDLRDERDRDNRDTKERSDSQDERDRDNRNERDSNSSSPEQSLPHPEEQPR